jgi:hypothetical protein
MYYYYYFRSPKGWLAAGTVSHCAEISALSGAWGGAPLRHEEGLQSDIAPQPVIASRVSLAQNAAVCAHTHFCTDGPVLPKVPARVRKKEARIWKVGTPKGATWKTHEYQEGQEARFQHRGYCQVCRHSFEDPRGSVGMTASPTARAPASLPRPPRGTSHRVFTFPGTSLLDHCRPRSFLPCHPSAPIRGNRTVLTAPYGVLPRKCFLPCHRTCDLASRLSLLSQPLRLLFREPCAFQGFPSGCTHSRRPISIIFTGTFRIEHLRTILQDQAVPPTPRLLIWPP